MGEASTFQMYPFVTSIAAKSIMIFFNTTTANTTGELPIGHFFPLCANINEDGEISQKSGKNVLKKKRWMNELI